MRSHGLLCWVSALVISSHAAAQCPPAWSAEGGPGLPGVGSTHGSRVFAVTSWDPDGSGPKPALLVAGGDFWFAGATSTRAIAAWDGAAWGDVGGSMPPPAWPSSNTVLSLGVHGDDLIAGGDFVTVGGTAAANIARWDGSAWHALGKGLEHPVRAIAVYNGELIAAGGASPPTIPQIPGFVARWTGTGWEPLGDSPDRAVFALAVHNGRLFAGGEFTQIGASARSYLAEWDGGAWLDVGGGMERTVRALISYGGALFAGGEFGTAGGTPVRRVAGWDGASWGPVGIGLGSTSFSNGQYVAALTIRAGELVAVGAFGLADGATAWNVASWDGSLWRPVGANTLGAYFAAATHAGDLAIGGEWVLSAGGVPVAGVAHWDGTAWGSYGATGGNGRAEVLGYYKGALIAGGRFSMLGGVPARGLARWDGGSWSAVVPYSSFTNSILVSIRDVQEFEGDLVVGGNFGVQAAEGIANSVARWDGSEWHRMGTNLTGGGVEVFEMYNGELVAGGYFGYSGGNVDSVARWTGTTWQELGGGTNGIVFSLANFEGKLVVGGWYTAVGAVPANSVATWNGSAWGTLGTGLGNQGCAVAALAVYGGALYAAGDFNHCYAQPSPVARWDGAAWTLLPPGPLLGPQSEGQSLVVHNGELILAGYLRGPQPKAAVLPPLAAWNGGSWSILGTGSHWGVSQGDRPALLPYGGDLWTTVPYIDSGALEWLSRFGCSCYADCTADGALTVADFGCFQTQFVAGDPYADCNGDGSLTVADFGCFQTKFVAGCP